MDDSARVSGTARVLENFLKQAPGVVDASFNLATMRVRVEFLQTATDARALRARIEELGYRVTDVTGGDQSAAEREEQARSAERRDLKRRLFVAVSL